MTEVSTRAFASLVRKLEQSGASLEPWVEGLPLTVEDLQDPNGKIPWSVFVQLLDRAQDACGGPEAFEELAVGVYQDPNHPAKRMLGLAIGPTQLYKMLALWRGSISVARMDIQAEERPDGRIEMTFVIPPDSPSTMAFWSGARGALRGIPSLLGLGESQIESLEIAPHRARLLITPPPSRSLWARGVRVTRRALSVRGMVEELGLQQAQLKQSYDQLQRAHAELERRTEALRESESRYQAVVDHTTDMIAIADADGRLGFVNRAVEEFMGRSASEMQGQRAMEAVLEEDRPRALRGFEQSIAGGSTGTTEFRVVRRDGSVRWVESSGRTFRTADGEDWMLTIARDIHARKQHEQDQQFNAERLEREVARRTTELEQVNRELRELQRRVIEAERMGAVGDLAARVAHAVNNPLTALIGHLELMLDGTRGKDPKVERLLQLAQRIRDVVQRTLVLFREGALDLMAESPREILEEVASEFHERCERQGIAVELKAPSGLPELVADRTLLISALGSIAENAIDAMPDGGTLDLEIGALPGLGVARFSVADRGPGVAPDLRERVFEPFYSTRPGGSGLGLSIASGVVRGHGGRIVIEDRPGGGALVHVDVPLRIPGSAGHESAI